MADTLLKNLDFIRNDGTLTEGLVPVRESFTNCLSIDEQAVLFEAKSFEHIDFVFFRRFSDKRSSQVAAYVVDNFDGNLDKEALSQLHRMVWLQGVAPLLYVSGVSQVDILACARKPDFWNKQKDKCVYKPASRIPFDLLTTAGQISDEMKKFSAHRLADGTFWDNPDNKKLAKYDKAAHFSLIQAVVEADRELDGENKPFMRRLLLLMVLIKYLEDRKVFPKPSWFGRYHKGARSFFDVLKGGNPAEVRRLLNFLTEKFNGDIFDVAKFNPGELSKKSLKIFAGLVEARTRGSQRYLWEQYSFEHLPVEIISHLYQRFIKDGVGAVYTPPFLAALLLDHTMPYNKITGSERILDPACGSGVFLVGAFKRQINFWKSKHNWKNLSVVELKKKLKENIYGIDLDPSAIDLTAFSLSLAICDALKPEVIWNELKFDCLRKANLIESDFFKLLLESQNNISNILDGGFDIIIGNPPFESKLTEAGKKVNNVTQQENSRGLLPNKQTAYLFLEQSLTVLKPKIGRICMIQPAGLLYNRKVNIFRSSLLKTCQVDTILDFTSIRKMYEANKQTIAVSACSLKPTENNRIFHWTFRRTVSVKERICFELDHYDHHCVLQKQAESDHYIWRIHLLGGGRLLDISKRFRGMRTLEKYLKGKKGWKYGEGFTIGNKKNEADFLCNEKYLPSEALSESGIDAEMIVDLAERKFERPRQKENYTPPLILIRKTESLLMDYWDEYFLSYSHEIVGIHAPDSQSSQLAKIYKLISNNKDFFRLMVNIHGSCALTERETAILKRDIDLLPYPKSRNSLSLSFWEKAIQSDVLKYMGDYIRFGQNSQLLQKNAKGDDMEKYSQMFCQMLGSIYSNLKSSHPIFLNGLICQPFYFGETPELSWLNEDDAEKELKKLIYSKHYDSLRTVRVFRFYDKNVLLIIKPNRLRYWIRSTAIQDADETLEDLCRQGY